VALNIEEILEKMAELLAKITVLPEGGLLPKTELAGENGLEPIDLVRLIIACEGKFKITIRDEDVYQWQCMGDIAAYIDGCLREGTADLALRSENQRQAWFYE
jgi:acyl carrier protein